MNLTQLKKTSKAGMYSTAQRTLYLRVAPGGSKQWMQRLTVAGKRHNLGLGSIDVVPFSAAAKAATMNLAAVYMGRNPIAEKREAVRLARIPTFAETVQATFEAQRARWSTAKSANKWLGLLQNYAIPTLGNDRVDRITSQKLMDTLLAVHKTAPDSARRLRQCMAVVFDHAIAQGHRSDNPAGAVASAMPAQAKRSKQHHATMGHENVAGAFAKLSECENVAARMILRFLTLTATRCTETRGARWTEIDMDSATWTTPASRMKTGVEHRVPLAPAAMDILKQAESIADGSGLVFPSAYRTGGMVSDKLLRQALRASTDVDCTVHGQRAAFQTWAAESGQKAELAEAALAHAKGAVTQAYQRSDLLEQRRGLMEAWARKVTQTSAKVHRLVA